MDKNKPDLFSDEKIPFLDRMMNSKLIFILSQYRKQASYGAIALLMLILVITWFSYSSKKKSLAEYQVALLLAEQLKKTPKLFENDTAKTKSNEQIFNELKTLASQDTLVQERFNGLIAEEIILKQNPDLPNPYAEQAIKKLMTSGIPVYGNFSEMSYLISKNKRREAYLVGQKLQTNQGILLQAFTLLQQAAIEKKLGKVAELKKTLTKLKALTDPSSSTDTSFAAISENDASELSALLQDKQNSLLEFLEQGETKILE